MLGLSELKQTRVYHSSEEVVKRVLKKALSRGLSGVSYRLRMIPRLQRGLSLEEIAELLELDVETIRRASQ